VLLLALPVIAAEEDPIAKLADATLAYFKPITGNVIRSEDGKIFISPGAKDELRTGMRLRVMREGEPFLHPVTKELIGKAEAPVGILEVREVRDDTVSGVLIQGEARAGDKTRLSDTKVRMLFSQDKGIDWYLADDYYRKLKASGRIDMVDTALETDDPVKVLEEARRLGAEVALLLTARDSDKNMFFKERVFWVGDGVKFLEMEIKVSAEYSKDVRGGEGFFTPRVGEPVMTFELPYRGRFVAAGNITGQGRRELLISNGKDVRVYVPDTDLKPLWEIKGSVSDEHVWLDTVDLNKNGKDEVVITSLRNSEIVSYIYEFTGEGFKLLWQGKYFMRRHGSGLIAQAFNASDGFGKEVLQFGWDGDYRAGEKLKLPKGVNIYDFAAITGTGNEPYIFAYDDKGFLNLYDEKGTRVWKSSADTGGFISTFKKPSTVEYRDAGEWSVKDRLIQRQREVMVVYRFPLASMVKTVGYKSSLIKSYWWNGFAMDEAVTIDGIKGSVQDYAVAGDRIFVLASPFLGLNFDQILKGESPLGASLSVYAVKGR